MKNVFQALKFPVVFILFLSSFIACDKDFSVIESDVLGEVNANFIADSVAYPITAYNKKLEAVQINNLASHFLGVFNDSEYGKTTASIVTQIAPNSASLNEDFDTDPVIDSVVINIPYFSSAVDFDDNGNTTYQLDSVYGNKDAKIKLTIYQNNYFLRDYDPSGNGDTAQNYYSKAEDLQDQTHNYAINSTQTIDFDVHKGAIIIDTTFAPSAKAVVLTTGEDETLVESRFAPSFRVSFNDSKDDADEIAFWNEAIVAKNGSSELSNANNFKNYFRGLYFKAEAVGTDGQMFLMDLASTDASITIYYTSGESTLRTQDQYVLTFSGNTLNTLKNDFSLPLTDGDKDNGDQTLYLKGLEGSMAVIDLFGTEDLDNNQKPDKLDDFLNEYREIDENTGEFIKDSDGNYVLKRIVNEAHLAIYEEDTKVSKTYNDNGDSYHKYDRIYAYDIKNNTTTIDYLFDSSDNSAAVFSKIFSLGLRDSISTTKAKYKIRLTEHLNNIIQNDSTNYNIGLVLSNNVNYTTHSDILNSNDDVTEIPTASIISPRGTILYGSHPSVDDEKRLTLKIFYTETK